jgi:squalene-associated FAD-dependent desaturase
MSSSDTVVVGAGWAGLATAVAFTRAGIPVKLYESARQIGGRARRVPFQDLTVDNGQHLFIGAYRETLAIMEIVGVDISKVLLRQRLQLISKYQDGKTLALKAPRLPAPLHLLWSLLTAQGLTTKERWPAIQLGLKLKLGRLKLTQDISVSEFLRQQGQPDTLNTAFWFPLCLAIMNTRPHEASAEIFIRVLADAFLYHQQDSNLLYARTDLSEVLPDPAVDYIEQHGSQVQLGQRVSRLEIQANRVTGIWSDNHFQAASQVVLALPPYATAPLLAPYPVLTALASNLQQFQYEPICTVYLQYPESVRLPVPMLGMLGGVGQWAFDRQLCGQPGLIAVVISSSGIHMAWPNSQLVDVISAELANLFPRWPQPTSTQVIREKRATFASLVNINQSRPTNQTAVEGLWLAGDFTQTGYPATLEGAVRSGVQCAQQILNQMN